MSTLKKLIEINVVLNNQPSDAPPTFWDVNEQTAMDVIQSPTNPDEAVPGGLANDDTNKEGS